MNDHKLIMPVDIHYSGQETEPDQDCREFLAIIVDLLTTAQ